MVAKFANDHQVVTEVRHYVAALDGEIWEEQVTWCRVNTRGDTGGADYNLASRGVDVGTGGAQVYVEVTRTRVGNSRVGLGYQGRRKVRSGATSRGNKSRVG